MSAATVKSSTSTYSPITLSSFPENPLTTTFTPPPACSGIYSSYVGVIDNDLSCMPAGFTVSSTDYFSPGLACPSGYVTACSDTQGVASITTVTCCPFRADITLSCVDPATLSLVWETLFCTWKAPKTGQVVSITVSTSGTTSTVGKTMTGPEGLNAYGVRMAYQSSDMALTTATTTGGATTTSGAAESTGSSGSTNGGGSGLSTGATIAIAVAIPVVVIAAAAGLFYWMRKRKQRSNAVQNTAGSLTMGPKEGHNQFGSPGNGGYAGYYEPHSPGMTSQLSAVGAAGARNQQNKLVELADHTNVIELPVENHQ